MSYFSATLDGLIHHYGLTQKALAESATVSQVMISKYINAEARPEVAVLERICNVFDADGAKLLVAFLRDEVPEAYERLVSIEPRERSARLKEDGPSILDRLTPKARKAIEAVARECERRPEMVAVIESVLAITRPQDR